MINATTDLVSMGASGSLLGANQHNAFMEEDLNSHYSI